MLRVTVLASGSKGNAIYVELDGIRMLVDAGISAARITKRLQAHGIDPKSLDALLITHEHIDHVRGLKTFTRQYHVPIFATSGTLSHIPGGGIFSKYMQSITESIPIGNVMVHPFPILHDAVDPCGFRITGSYSCTIATDLGVVTDTVQNAIEDSDVLILEANHDMDMLRKGRYPWSLKRRILSNRGHLANSEAGWALTRMNHPPHKVLLAHLSEENNSPDLAEKTIKDILASRGMILDIETCQPEGGAEIIL